MDKEKVNEVIQWWKAFQSEHYGVDFDEYAREPLMEAFGDDAEEIIAYLNDMDVEDLDLISGCFEAIYGKFTTDEVYEALGELEDKLNNA